MAFRSLTLCLIPLLLACGSRSADEEGSSERSPTEQGRGIELGSEFRRNDSPKQAPGWALKDAGTPQGAQESQRAEENPTEEGSDAPPNASAEEKLNEVRRLPVKRMEEIPEELREYLKDLPPGVRVHYGEAAPIVTPDKKSQPQPQTGEPPAYPQPNAPTAPRTVCESECDAWRTKSYDLFRRCVEDCHHRDLTRQADDQMRELESKLRRNAERSSKGSNRQEKLSKEEKELLDALQTQLIEELKKAMGAEEKR